MAKPTILIRKLFFAVIIVVLFLSSILVGIKTILIIGHQGPVEPQGENGDTEPTGENGSTETSDQAGSDDETRAQEPQGEQGPYLPIYNNDWIEKMNKISQYGFSIAWITDTQLNSEDDTWGNFTKYLVSVRDAYNIKAVVHTGDIVENGSATEEWEVANASMGVLLDNNMPYCWCTGNHDYWGEDLSANYLAFNVTSQETETYWYSSYGNRSTAIQFTYGDYDFIVVCVEFHGDAGVIAWLTNILDNNPDKNILVATHSYLNATGGYGDQWGETWGKNFRALLDNYTNVFATINGHWTTSYHQTIGNRTEMMADYMNTNFMVVTYLFFDVINGQVYVRTYQQTGDIWYTANAQNFRFDVDLV
jgi:3',5'-cyclic AMP phosphodiesterase CpdA